MTEDSMEKNVFAEMGEKRWCCGVLWFGSDVPYFADSIALDEDGEYEIRVEDGWYFYVTSSGAARQRWLSRDSSGEEIQAEANWLVTRFELFGDNPSIAYKGAKEKYPALQLVRDSM